MQINELKAVNVNDVDWQETRFDDNYIKVLSFRDGVVFELQRFDSNSYTFPHKHGFRQLRYILEGEFVVNGKRHGPGTLIDFPENEIYEVDAPSGGIWIVVQMPGAHTSEAPTDPTGLSYGKAPSREQIKGKAEAREARAKARA